MDARDGPVRSERQGIFAGAGISIAAAANEAGPVPSAPVPSAPVRGDAITGEDSSLTRGRVGRALAGGVGLLLLAVAWLLPPLLDWDRYRDSIAVLASDRLGREVRIAGPVSLTLLPEPVLTAAGVSLADAGDGIAIRAAQLRLRVALGALAAGRIDAEELVLSGAEMHVPWPFRPIRIAAAAPSWFAAASVRVEDATLTIGHLAFTAVEATLATDPWTGTITAAGTLELSARPWHFTARLSRPGRDGSAGLDASLDGRGPVQGAGARLSGQIHGDGTFGGRVMGRGPDLSQLLPAPALPFTAAGRVTLAGGLATAEDWAGDIGGSPVKGGLTLRVAPALRLDMALAASRLDLDTWLPALLRGGAAPFPAGLLLSAEAAQLAGGTLRQVRGAFDIGAGAVAVRGLHAVLPGEAVLDAAGQVQRPESSEAGGAARFEGDVTLVAPALRTTLAWLAAAGVAPAAMLPEGVLRSADLTARAVLEPGRLSLTRLEGRADAARLAGSLDYRAARGARPRPVFAAVLETDRLELDPWLPSAWPGLAAIPARLERMDAGLRLTASQAVLQGVPFGPLTLDAAAESGQLRLRRLELASGETRLAASGTLGEGGRITDLRLDLQAPSATALAESLPMAWLPAAFPAAASLRDMTRFWRGPAAVSVLAAGPPGALALRVAADLGDLRLEAQPLIDLGGRRATGVLTLRHPGAPRLAESVGLRGVASWLGDGSLGLVAQVSVQLPTVPVGGAPGRVVAESFDLTAGSLRAGGMLTLESIGDPAAPPRLSGRIVADTLPLPLPYPRSPDPLPFAMLAGWQAQVKLEAAQVLAGASPLLRQAAATLALADGRLRIDALSARLAEGQLTGAASVDAAAAAGPALALELRLAGATLTEPLFELPVDIASGRLEAALSLAATGHSPAALLATLSGEARLAVTDGTLAGVLPGGGTAPFTRVEILLRARRGLLQVAEGRMTAPAGAAVLAGSVDLPGNAADLRLDLLPAETGSPGIGIVFAGPLEALRLVPDPAAARWRAGHPAPEPP